MQKKYLLPKGDQFDKDQILTDRCYFRFMAYKKAFSLILLIVISFYIIQSCGKKNIPEKPMKIYKDNKTGFMFMYYDTLKMGLIIYH